MTTWKYNQHWKGEKSFEKRRYSEKVFHDAAEYINMHPGNFFKSDAEELKKFNSTEFKEHAMSELQGSMAYSGNTVFAVYTAADLARHVWNIFLNWAWGW